MFEPTFKSALVFSVDDLPDWAPNIFAERDRDGYTHGECLLVLHDGKVTEHWDGGEPEDASFGRDWSWIPPTIDTAYKAGVTDGLAQAACAASKADTGHSVSGPFSAFPDALIPTTLAEALDLLEETRSLLADECRQRANLMNLRVEEFNAALKAELDRRVAAGDFAYGTPPKDPLEAVKNFTVVWLDKPPT